VSENAPGGMIINNSVKNYTFGLIIDKMENIGKYFLFESGVAR
jgi:hypothetical protein